MTLPCKHFHQKAMFRLCFSICDYFLPSKPFLLGKENIPPVTQITPHTSKFLLPEHSTVRGTPRGWLSGELRVSLQCHNPVPQDQHHLREAQWHSRPYKGCSSEGEHLQLSFEEEDLNSAPSQALARLPNRPVLSTLPDYERCSSAEAVRVKAH